MVRATNGRYYVSTARQSSTDTHKLVQLSALGRFEVAFALPTAAQLSANGLYDLAYDEVANVIYGGSDYSTAGRFLFAFDVGSSAFRPSVAIPNTVAGSAARALTYNPEGNLGAGSFWIGDGASNVSEISKTGTFLRSAPAIHPATQAAACDAERNLIWWFGPGDSTRTNQGVVGKAMLASNATLSTQKVLGDNSIPGTPLGGTVRGVEFYERGKRHEDLHFVILTDATKDHVYEMGPRLQVEDGCTGATVNADGDACFAGNLNWKVLLVGSSAQFATLTVAASENAGIPLPTPPFLANCTLFVDPMSLVILPAIPVVAGRAIQPAPIPTSVFGASVYFQWVELLGAGSYGISDEGEVYVHN